MSRTRAAKALVLVDMFNPVDYANGAARRDRLLFRTLNGNVSPAYEPDGDELPAGKR